MKSINGREVHITPSHGHDLNIEGVSTVDTNLRVGHGVVHILPKVLLTPAYLKVLSPSIKVNALPLHNLHLRSYP